MGRKKGEARGGKELGKGAIREEWKGRRDNEELIKIRKARNRGAGEGNDIDEIEREKREGKIQNRRETKERGKGKGNDNEEG